MVAEIGRGIASLRGYRSLNHQQAIRRPDLPYTRRLWLSIIMKTFLSLLCCCRAACAQQYGTSTAMRARRTISPTRATQAAQRLEQLAGYRAALHAIAGQTLSLNKGDPRLPVFQPLAETIQRHALPLEPFFDLLSAFEQDVSTTRYEGESQLLDYCRRSANPVGRMMLHL